MTYQDALLTDERNERLLQRAANERQAQAAQKHSSDERSLLDNLRNLTTHRAQPSHSQRK